MSDSYAALASAYDGLMADVRYPQRIRYLHTLLRQAKVHTLADLGCGTGTIACALSQRGYQVTAMDPSPDMLTEAMEKAVDLETPPLFVCQTMDKLALPAPVDGIISTIDAVNYVTAPKALERAFFRMYRQLNQGGRLIFDVNTPHKYQAMDAQMYVDETEDTYCVWRTFYSPKSAICTYQVDLFAQEEDGTWVRDFEQHRQRAYSRETLEGMLQAAGFTAIQFYSDLTTAPATDADARWIVVCDKV
ncbi:class I SAM-dependent methyltransferase [Bengtsoniella intestinalis]|uniref:class I SAM-dependent DNA methyltransferase n=1 Tax=Bengtsoniella intestinalis TaxID=3073143 RepID=UPI00391F9B11